MNSQIILYGVLASSIAMVIWPYLGYPIWLRLLALFRHRDASPELSGEFPTVTLFISAFNEASVIRDKLENALALDYPTEKFEIRVISDASDDGTDEIVHEFNGRRVFLHRQHDRRGKSAGLTKFVPLSESNLLVFTDANAMFERDAIRQLVKHFVDGKIGYVVGQQKYCQTLRNKVSVSEGLYWRYETVLKQMESNVGSVVGGDGAIYAIRRELFFPLQYDDINDFLNPLQIVARGFEGIYEPAAICFEEVAGSFQGEFRRKIRIVNRSIRALFRVPQAMSPFRTGWFSFHLISHKFLRWLAGFFMAIALITNVALVAMYPNWFAASMLTLQGLFYACAALGLIPALQAFKLFYLPFYFCLGNIAAGQGVVSYLLGKRYVTWQPDRGGQASSERRHITSAWLLVTSVSVLLLMSGLSWFVPQLALAICLAWLAITYFAYPFGIYCVSLMSSVKQKTARESDDLPTVSLIIPAHNEVDCIDEKIRNSLASNYPANLLQVMVVDDASQDGTSEVLNQWSSEICVLRLNRRHGKSGALRKALEACDSEIIVFTDANVHVDVNAIRLLVDALQPDEVGCATANVRLTSPNGVLDAESTYQKFEFSLLSWESRVYSAVCVDGGLYAIKRAALASPQEACILDDFAISTSALNAGWKIRTVPAALALEASSLSLSQEFGRRKRLGAGAVQALKRAMFPSPRNCVLFSFFLFHKASRWASPFLGIIAVMAILKIAWESQRFGTGVLILFGLSALGVAATQLQLMYRLPFIKTIGYSVTVFAGLTWGMLTGIFVRSPAAWSHGPRSGLPNSNEFKMDSTGQ